MYLNITDNYLGLCNINITLHKVSQFNLILYQHHHSKLLYQNKNNNLNFSFRLDVKSDMTQLYLKLNNPDLIKKMSLDKIFKPLSIDKIYYINLKHRPNRRQNIEKELYKLGVPKTQVQYVEAVYLPDNPQIGCAYSHLKVLSDASKQNYRHILVLEDDFIFNTTRSTLDTFINNLTRHFTNWDLCLLTSINYQSTPSKIPTIQHLTKGDTTAGYLISNTCYHLIFNIFLNCTKPKIGFHTNQFAIDVAWQQIQQKIRSFISIPLLGKQDSQFKSDIEIYRLKQFG